MARFFGAVGYGTPQEIRPGVWDDLITERDYYGEVKFDTLIASVGSSVLPEKRFQTQISVMADAEMFEKYTAIRYVKWAGSAYTVTSVKVARPRLILMLGEVYHGPLATP